MSEFTPINTQEEFNAAIGDRLRKNEEKWQRKYEGFLSPDEVEQKTDSLNKQISDLTNALSAANDKISGYDQQISERDAKIKGYEVGAIKSRIALELGLSGDAIGFLSGDTEDAIRSSADSLKSLIGVNRQQAPAFTNEPRVSNDPKIEACRNMLKELF